MHDTFGSDMFEAVSQQDFLTQKIEELLGLDTDWIVAAPLAPVGCF